RSFPPINMVIARLLRNLEPPHLHVFNGRSQTSPPSFTPYRECASVKALAFTRCCVSNWESLVNRTANCVFLFARQSAINAFFGQPQPAPCATKRASTTWAAPTKPFPLVETHD